MDDHPTPTYATVCCYYDTCTLHTCRYNVCASLCSHTLSYHINGRNKNNLRKENKTSNRRIIRLEVSFIKCEKNLSRILCGFVFYLWWAKSNTICLPKQQEYFNTTIFLLLAVKRKKSGLCQVIFCVPT